MYLKRLEIQGFKSFADKTVIKFESGITGVVGPNGSGKSNISDSIRWVLGEQSIKSLRGNKMEDVIFSGASGRNALGFAEVTMVLDNTEGIFPIEYEELAVTRRMFRSGESEYYINRNSCRLRDIRELFMDTGIGKDGYSIIGQGRIDDILSSKSEDRRKIFEEAAGIVKYKSRKEESERKLQRTRDNLVRIDDIISELESQIGPLSEQSEKAKRYLEVSETHKKLDLELFAMEFESLKSEEEKCEIRLSEVSKELEENSKLKDSLKEKISSDEESVEELEEELLKANEEKYSILAKNEKLEGQVRLYEEQIKSSQRDIERIERETAEQSEEQAKLQSEMELKTRSREECLEKLESKNKTITQSESELSEIMKRVAEIEESVEQRKEEALELLNYISEEKLKLNTLDSNKESLKLRAEQISKEIERNKSKAEEVSRHNLELSEKLEKMKKSLAEIESETSVKKSQREQKLESKKKVQNYIEGLKSGLQSKQSNLKFLREMKEEYEGYYKGVKNFLIQSKNIEELQNGIDGLVAELLSVSKEHEKAIEVALGGSLQHIVVGTQRDGKRCIEFLKKRKLGRITFLPRESIKGKSLNANEDRILSESGVLGLASDIVEYDARYSEIFKNLLGRTVVIDNMDTMISISKKYGNYLKFVTLEGDVLNPGGSMTGGSFKGNSLSLLGRERQIKELEDGILSGKSEYSEKVEIYRSLEDEISSLETELVELEKSEREISYEKNRLESQYSHTSEQEAELAKGASSYEQETVQIEEELQKLESRRALVEQKIEEHKENIDRIQLEVENQSREIEKEKSVVEQDNVELTEQKIERASIEESLKSADLELDRISKEIEKTVRKLESLNSERERLSESRIKIESDIESSKVEIEGLKSDIQLSEESIEKLKQSKVKVLEALKEAEAKYKQLELVMESIEKERLKLELCKEKAEVKLDSLRERIWDEYELSYSMVLNMELDGGSRAEIESELQTAKQELRKIGNVNLESIEEYEKVSERYNFLNKQREDLIEAEKSLKHVIKEMNHKMKEQFKYKFEEIRIQFAEIFVAMFGGGKADIRLEEPEEVLESGIEIIAQPPGKKLQSLSLLSGGERALTAIAILFAILKTRSTPFCILDEIEAALDESNVYRYAEYLESFSKDTQFIVITHRKGTMESADSLYGVTMEDNGISKIISVKLTDKLIEESSRG